MELVALIAEKTSSFGLDATVDRFDGGRYQAGEAFSIRVSPEKPGYLYLLHIDSQGALSLLYPLPGQDNRIGTQKPLIVPGPGDPFAFRTAAPPGTNRVKILVTSRPLALTGLLPLSQQQEADGAAAVQGQDNVRQQFRWHPTQRLQIRELLRQYQERNSLQPKQVDNIDPRTLLGPFAQDEVAFYVEPPK